MKTNKTFKKITSAATAAILATCAMTPISITNVSAASIEITNSQAGHTYEAYQIFKGDLSGDKLSNIQWGSNVDTTGDLMTQIKALNGFSSCSTAADVADALSNSNDSDIAKQFAIIIGSHLTGSAAGTSTATSSPYNISVADNGYYLIKDKDDTLNNQEDKSYTEYVVQVLGDKTNIAAKSALPTFEKKVNDINDTTSAAENLVDYADHDKGDKVTFTLKGTLPTNYDAYTTTYKYVMHDSLSNGLTFDASSVVVKVGATTLTSGTDYTVKTSTSDNHTFDIEFPNLKNVPGVTAASEIVVTYTATLNDSADIGKPGNPNEAYLEYSNNPYDDSDTGKTPPDEVIVYTYDVIIDKVDGNNQPLAQAGFTLYKYNGSSWVEVKKIAASAATTFTFSGIDDGKYKIEETETPSGFNTIKPIYFEVTADHTNGLTTLTVQEQDDSGAAVSSGGYTFTATADSGEIKTTVQNKSGSSLPSTGGIGTTPFYVGGGVLVAAAGVYLIVKKRMKNNENK